MKKTHKWLYLGLCLILILAVALAGCGGAKEEPKPADQPQQTAEPAKEIPVLLGAGAPEWTTYPIAVGTSDIVSKNSNLNITVRSHGGEMAIVQSLAAKNVDFALGQRDTAMSMAYGGFGEWKGERAKNLRAVVSTMVLVSSLNVTVKSGIKTVPELKGKRVDQKVASTNIWAEGALEAYGLDPKTDVKWVRIEGEGDWLKEMSMNRLDAFWGDLGGSDVLQLSEAVGKLRPLPIEPDKLQYLKDKYKEGFSGVQTVYLQPGRYSYVDISAPVPMTGSPIMIGTRVDVPEDVVYTYTKTWLENLEKMKTVSDAMKDYSVDHVKLASAIPFHDGAIKALKEKGYWTEQMEKEHQKALAW